MLRGEAYNQDEDEDEIQAIGEPFVTPAKKKSRSAAPFTPMDTSASKKGGKPKAAPMPSLPRLTRQRRVQTERPHVFGSISMVYMHIFLSKERSADFSFDGNKPYCLVVGTFLLHLLNSTQYCRNPDSSLY